MPTRLLGLVALVAITLSACSPTSPPVQPTPSSRWNPEEQTAVTEATAQYKKARAAYDAALQHPETATRAALEAAGNSGTWLDEAVSRADALRTQKTRRVGSVKILSTEPIWVDLTATPAAVVLKTCLDYSAVADHTTNRRLVDAHLAHLPTGWSLTTESDNPDTAQPPTPNRPLC
ncbi:hypothetical protein ACIA49_12655 [Kribbella sp. NPDC051587]|uniref:hypothetical protein n=1 Tax=Kribbella sp. NPDC051587 TaxID=3364119 RepID=UPI0037BD3F83